MSDDDEDEPQIPEAVLNVAIPAQQLLTAATALAEIHGPAALRNALFVALTVFSERTLGERGMRDELHEKVARLMEEPVIADVVKWLH